MKKIIFRNWPLIFIFLIWFIFSSPYFLNNKAPFSASYQLNNFSPWDTYAEFRGPIKNGAMPDVITQIYPWRHLAMQIWQSGQIPLWNPYSFAGTPLLANYQSAVLSPLNILFLILPFVDGWSLLVLFQPLLAGFFTFLFVRTLDRSNYASLISAISFMFCGFITSWMGYATLGYSILFLPLGLYAIEKYYFQKKNRFLMLLSATVPLSFFSGHFQISAYFIVFLSAYTLYKLIDKKDVKAFVKTLFFLFFGLLLSMPQLIPSIEFYSQSFRSSLFQKGEVIPLGYLPTLLAPDFFGNPVTRNDWFGHYAEWNGYIGVLPLILSIYAMTARNKSKIWFFLVSGILAIVISLDTKFADLFINLKIPVLSTSAVSRIIVIYSFMFSVLSAFGLDNLIEDIKNNKKSKVLLFLASFLAIFIFLWLSMESRIFVPYDKIFIAQNNLKLPTLIFFVSFAALLITAFNKRLVYIFIAIILLLVSFDMLRFATKWQEFSPKKLVFADNLTTEAFSKISGQDRSMSNLEAGVADYYNILSLEGYDALYIKRYGEFAASISDGKLKDSYRSVVLFPKDGKFTSSIINLLDVKYVLHKKSDGRAGWTFPFWTYPDDQFKNIYSNNSYEFHENTKAFPHIFLANEYKVVSDSQQILNALTSESVDLRKTVILEEDPKISLSKSASGAVKILKYSPNEINTEVGAKGNGILFVSDNYYPGWKALIDGKETKIYRADYSFRAIMIPDGEHVVKFVYEPFSFILGLWLAIAGVLGMVAFILIPKILIRKSSS